MIETPRAVRHRPHRPRRVHAGAGVSCDICAHAAEHGSWPQDLLSQGGTHCRDCHRSWVSKVEAHCVVCHCHFSTDSTAELHEPLCSPTTTVQDLLGGRRSGGNPIFALRERSWGPVLVRWSPADAERPW